MVILQHYLDISPSLDEIFSAWREGDKYKNDKLVEAAVDLLRQIIDILIGLPFFRKSLLTIINRLIATAEPYHDLVRLFPQLAGIGQADASQINSLIQSQSRDHALIGLRLAASAVHADSPSDGSSFYSSTTSSKVWMCLVEGGSLRMLGKLMGMRKRNKEGVLGYGTSDPLDKPGEQIDVSAPKIADV